jgi:isopenicillin N synthase-like dioxygenase
MRYWCFTTNHRGYVPFEENGTEFPRRINFNEAFDLSFEAPADHPDHLAEWRMTGPNVWPDLPGWQETVRAYYDAVFALGLRLLDALALALQVDPAELRRHITCPTSQLRLMRYVENDMPVSKDLVGIDAHSDFECFTILLQGGPGLQVMTADDYWIEAPPCPAASSSTSATSSRPGPAAGSSRPSTASPTSAASATRSRCSSGSTTMPWSSHWRNSARPRPWKSIRRSRQVSI